MFVPGVGRPGAHICTPAAHSTRLSYRLTRHSHLVVRNRPIRASLGRTLAWRRQESCSVLSVVSGPTLDRRSPRRQFPYPGGLSFTHGTSSRAVCHYLIRTDSSGYPRSIALVPWSTHGPACHASSASRMASTASSREGILEVRVLGEFPMRTPHPLRPLIG